MSKKYLNKNDPSYSAFLPLRNMLKKTDKKNFLIAFLTYSSKYNQRALANNRIMTWMQLFLIKMSLVFGKQSNELVTFKQCSSIHYSFLEFWNHDARFFNRGLKNSIPKFFRSLIQQQHQYVQVGNLMNHFSMQTKIYLESKSKFEFKKVFFELNGIELEYFLNNLFVITLILTEIEKEFFFDESLMSQVEKLNTFPQLRETVNLLSGDIEKLKELASEDFSKIPTLLEELCTRSPFITKPFYYDAILKRYFILDKGLLHLTLEQYIYGIFKKSGVHKESFCEALGEILEKEVYEILRFTLKEEVIFKEKQLIKRFPATRVPDFYVNLKNLAIFIDAKAVEGNHLANVSSHEETLNRNYSKSICKGIAQCLNLIQQLKSPVENNVIIIVTMFETYLGHGSRLYDEMILNSLKNDYGYTEEVLAELIDPDFIFVIPFATFNNLFTKGLESENLKEFFSRIKAGNEKAYFDMFIREYLPADKESYLSTIYSESSIGKIFEAFQKQRNL